MFRKMLFVCLVLILTACQGGPLFHFGPTPTPFPEKFTGVAQVGPYKLVMFCEGKGEPTIILENGLDGASWNAYSLARFKTISRTCTYLRAGMGGTKIDGPRTTLDQVKDLHSLLTQVGVPGPYILVGHSTAGSNMVLYTDQYPKDVVGLVCVDCRYPAYSPIFLKKLDSQNPNDTAAINQARSDEKSITKDIWKQIKEHLDILTSDQQVLKVTSLGDRPFIVLIAGATGDYIDDKEVRQLLEEAWMEGSQMLSKLSTRGQIEIVPDVNHDTILTNDKVDAAIQQVYAAVKAGK
jgi:pimeloyl-ACP methyl ester carboxylesterase